jgi:hypothetical protein
LLSQVLVVPAITQLIAHRAALYHYCCTVQVLRSCTEHEAGVFARNLRVGPSHITKTGILL